MQNGGAFANNRAATLEKCGSGDFLRFSLPKGVVNFGVKYFGKFSVLRFPEFGSARANFHQNFMSKTV